MLLAYVRVSTKEQNEDRQVDKMVALGVERRFVLVEKESGKNFEDRPVYQTLRNMLQEGDLLYIDSIDRLGRSFEGVIKEWNAITKEIKADVVALDMSEVFDSRKFKAQGEIGKLLEQQMLSLLAWVADQERNKIITRCQEGRAAAKQRGVKMGRKPIEIDKTQFEIVYGKVERGEITNKYAEKLLGMKHTTYFTTAKQYREKTGLWAEQEKAL